MANPDPVSPSLQRRWATRLLLWLLGGWFFLSVTMAFVASGNFRVLDSERLRQADVVYAEIPAGAQRRQDLRYAASELNRYYFSVYNSVQLAIAGVAVGLLWLSRRPGRITAAALLLCLALAALFWFWFTPTMIDLGRAIDFVPRDPEPPQVVRFYSLHRINVTLEMVKIALLGGIAVAVARR